MNNQKINIDLFEDEEKIDNVNYLKSPFNYTGSKSNLMPQLKLYLPKNIETCYDLFCGGGGFFINVLDNFPKIITNDIIVPLVQFYEWLQVTEWNVVLEEINKRNNLKNDKEKYFEFREKFNQTKNCIDFFILVCSCTNNMARFSKKQFSFNQTWGNRCFNKSTEVKLKEYHDRIYRNKNIEFNCKNFFNFNIKKGDFVYLDSPYLISEAGYNAFWSKEFEEKLYSFIDELDKIGAYFMMSNVAEHKGIINSNLDKVKKYRIIELEYDYNKVSRSGKSGSKEIIVVNY